MTRALAVIAVALTLAVAPAGQAPRIVAIGDIHGDVDGLTAILREARLIDGSGAWAGGPATLVQTGDYLDRGEDVRAVMDLLIALEAKAKAGGGRVVTLLGNHEAMNLLGVTRDATPEIYATFADAGSRARLDAAWAQYQKLGAALAATNEPVPPALARSREAFERAYPRGYIEYRDAIGPRGQYGRWLREKPMVVTLGDTIFLHAGIPLTSAPERLEALNSRIRDEARRMDRFVQRLVDKKLALPFFTLDDVLDVASAQITAANRASAAAKTTGDARPLARLDLEFLREAEAILGVDKWLGLDADGALWWRGLADLPDDPTGGPLQPLLQRFKATRVVAGHTPTSTRRITMRFGGRAVLLDTGMNRQIYNGNPAALEIVGDDLAAIYLDRREPLTAPARPAAALR
jgi:hypothetical protein